MPAVARAQHKVHGQLRSLARLTKEPGRLLLLATLVMIAALPFHAAMVVVLGTWTGHPSLIAAWKELLIVVLTIPALVQVWRQASWKQFAKPIPVLIVSLAVLGLIVSGIQHVSLRAALFGTKTDLLPWVLFLIALQASGDEDGSRLQRILLWSGGVVSVLALAQSYLIPIDQLRALGYSASTILPAQFIDPALPNIRAFSTLGGPNQLGAYLIIPITVAIVAARRQSVRYLLWLPLLFWALYVSYSRSAWIAIIVAIVAALILTIPRQLQLPVALSVLVIGVGLIVLAFNTTFTQRQTGESSTIEHLLLHGQINRQTFELEGSDSGRLKSLRQGAELLRSHPFGLGLGSAGPASYKTTTSLITENWYLQIGLEFGWLGLGLMLALLALIAWQLLQLSYHSGTVLAPALYASLIGVLVCNLFLHSFADSTLSLVMCGSLGLTLRPREGAQA